jgi:hypothetical protein
LSTLVVWAMVAPPPPPPPCCTHEFPPHTYSPFVPAVNEMHWPRYPLAGRDDAAAQFGSTGPGGPPLAAHFVASVPGTTPVLPSTATHEYPPYVTVCPVVYVVLALHCAAIAHIAARNRISIARLISIS